MKKEGIPPPLHHEFRLSTDNFNRGFWRLLQKDQGMANQGRQGLFHIKSKDLPGRDFVLLHPHKGGAQGLILFGEIGLIGCGQAGQGVNRGHRSYL